VKYGFESNRLFQRPRSPSLSEQRLCAFSIGNSERCILVGPHGTGPSFEDFEKVSKCQYNLQTRQSISVALQQQFRLFFVKMIENSAMARSAEVSSEQIAALNAKSDAELAAVRLNRSDIALHVFRDRLYI